MEQVEIVLNGIDLTVWGYYTKGEQQTYDYVGSNSEFDLREVYISDSDTDIMQLMEAHYTEIEELAIKQLER